MPVGSVGVDVDDDRKTAAGVSRARESHPGLIPGRGKPDRCHIVTAGGQCRAVDRAAFDEPTLVADVERRGPAAAHPAPHDDVANLFRGAVTIGNDWPFAGHGDVRLAAIANHVVDDLPARRGAVSTVACEPEARSEQRVGIVERPVGQLPAVEPESRNPLVPGKNTDETVLGNGIVFVHLLRRGPGRTPVARDHRGNVVGRTALPPLQPVREPQAPGDRRHRREIGPVDEHLLAARHFDGCAESTVVVARVFEDSLTTCRLEPAQHEAAVRPLRHACLSAAGAPDERDRCRFGRALAAGNERERDDGRRRPGRRPPDPAANHVREPSRAMR